MADGGARVVEVDTTAASAQAAGRPSSPRSATLPARSPDVDMKATAPASPTESRAAPQPRASLNALAAMVDYGARITIQLLLAPLMLRYLGAGGFGTWQVLQTPGGPRDAGRGTPGRGPQVGGRPGQSSDDAERKRQQVGTAVRVWALFLPLVLVLGLGLAWVSPALVHASGRRGLGGQGRRRPPGANVALMGLAGLPQSVLQGENLGYRRLGLSTAILFVSAAVAALTLWAGWGLVGLAAATLVGTVLSGADVRPHRAAPGPLVGHRTTRPRCDPRLRVPELVVPAVEPRHAGHEGRRLIVLGALAGTAMVATYSLTSLVPQAVSDVVFMVISATMPGLGGIVGAGRPRARRPGAGGDAGALLAARGRGGSDRHRLAAGLHPTVGRAAGTTRARPPPC